MTREPLAVTKYPLPDVVPFDLRTAFRFLKIRPSSGRLADLRTLVESGADQCREKLMPAYRYVIHGVDQAEDGRVVLSRKLEFTGSGLSARLSGSHEAALFVLTLGQEIQRLIDEAGKEDMLLSYLLDGVASTFAHGLLSLVETDLHESAKTRGSTLTARISPGYHKWDLTQQRALFDVTDAESLGVRLTPGHFMVPRQCLSGAYGLVLKTASNS